MLRIIGTRNNRSTLSEARQKLIASLQLINGHEKSAQTAIKAYKTCLTAISIADRIPEAQITRESADFLLMAHLHAMRIAIFISSRPSITAYIYQHAHYLEQNISEDMVTLSPTHAVEKACALFYISQIETDTKKPEELLIRGRSALLRHFSPKNIGNKAKDLNAQQTLQLAFCFSEFLKALYSQKRLNESRLIASMLMTIIEAQLESNWCDLIDYLPNIEFDSQELNTKQAQLRKVAAASAYQEAKLLFLLKIINPNHAKHALACCNQALCMIKALPAHEQKDCAQLEKQCHDLIAEIDPAKLKNHFALPTYSFTPLEQCLLTSRSNNPFCYPHTAPSLNLVRLIGAAELPRVYLFEDQEDEEPQNLARYAVTALRRNRTIGMVRVEREESSQEYHAELEAAGDIIRKKQRH